MQTQKITKRWISMLLAVLCVFSALTGCAASESQEKLQTRTVVDMAGRTVEVPAELHSYVALWVSTVPLALMLDHGEHMVGCSETASFYPLFERVCSNYNNLTYFNNDALTLESILETGTEVVFYRGADHADLAEKLAEAGVAAVDLEFNTYDEMMKALEIMADVFNTDSAREKTTRYISYATEAIEKAEEIGNAVEEHKTALVIRDTANLRAYGVNRFAGKWVTLCGGDYALKEGDPNGYVNLTNEQLFEYDPEYIIFVIPGEAKKFVSDPKWSALKAVKEGHVFENPSVVGTWSNHGTEFVLQFWWAFDIMYPDQFGFDLQETVKDFYLQFYDIELTSEEIDSMINIR